MVAFWRKYPLAPPFAETERRLANFVARPPNMPHPKLANEEGSVEDYFNTHFAEIESDPMRYASLQKMMVRQAMNVQPSPNFCQMVETIWPR